MEDTYKIVRVYEKTLKHSRVQKRGLTLEQAQKWCNDPETSSMTARKPLGCDGDDRQIERWHDKQKHWFDGFIKEEK